MSQLDDVDERSRDNRKRIEALERVVAELAERAGIAFDAHPPPPSEPSTFAELAAQTALSIPTASTQPAMCVACGGVGVVIVGGPYFRPKGDYEQPCPECGKAVAK
jgi:hypothetical protein